MKDQSPLPSRVRVKLALHGAVQGVGFRPFVHRLATELSVTGWVKNSPQGVFIEAESPRPALEKFLRRMDAEKPPRSFIQNMETTWLDAVGFNHFEIRASETGGNKTALVLPDMAACADCVSEIFDPKNRRHLYPFTNCTHCGPRFSIIEALPYDRANTSMSQFAMCPACQAEYDDPHDRRFHAQPNACPVCGPHLELWSPTGERVFGAHEALPAAAGAIRQGKIVAVKGLGGFHLLVDARNEKAVQLLRTRKHREEKPFALMFPSLESVKNACEVSPLEERLLCSAEAPIALLRRLKSQIPAAAFSTAKSVAPGNPYLGAMLPSNPLHHLLMAELKIPVVATSGNLSDEPICTDEQEALERLGSIADLFLVHNRPIVRHVDDSVVRVMAGRAMILRRARGYAPLPISLAAPLSPLTSQPILAVGGHLKNSVALAVGSQVFISQHIGDLETEPAHRAFCRVISDFEKLYGAKPEIVAADLHPDYLSTKFARELKNARQVGVQHHLAHVFSCMAENVIAPPALGVSWDGTGYGLDGTIWGGEFFVITKDYCERAAHLRPFRLPGGDQAMKEPRRAALGLLYEMLGEAPFPKTNPIVSKAFSKTELAALVSMLKNKINSPLTSSVGRLFDAVASLTGLRQTMRFEGQAAMELEFVLEGIETDEAYDLPLITIRRPFVLDWAPMVSALLADVKDGVSIATISAKFHNALAEAVVSVAKHVEQDRVVLSGGCFQNRYLTERIVYRLQAEGFRPYWHQRVPTNDGGLALGQIAGALWPGKFSNAGPQPSR